MAGTLGAVDDGPGAMHAAPMSTADPGAAPFAGERMHFTRMDEGTDEDFRILREVHERNLAALPDVLFGMLSDLSADAAYNLNRRDHCLQTATRALRDGADEEMVVVALFHDVGESLGPLNHGDVAAAILRPFISDDNYWLLAHHPLFQTYFYARHLGLDPNARDKYKGHPAYQKTVDFCARWDEVSFDPAYPNEPLGTFEPMVHRVLSKPWRPPGA
jgi:predicted HD phosphohydrolase